jgi:hypothetical protein
MRGGKVRIIIEYAVDLDKLEQVEVAKDFVYEDAYSAIKYNDLGGYLEVIEDASVTENDIHSAIIELTTDTEDWYDAVHNTL